MAQELKFGSGFKGRLVTPRTAAYSQSRAVFNGAIDPRPAAIAFCQDTDDIRYAIAAGREASLPLAIRSTGHGISGNSTPDNALVIDLSTLNRVSISDSQVDVGGGATLAQMDSATTALGLAVPGGTVSSTGVGGLALGGGIGWLLPQSGLTCDNLVSVEIVTADGQLRHIDDASDPEAMWVMRGSGFGLGAITQFRFAASRLPSLIAGSIYVDLGKIRSIMAPIIAAFQHTSARMMVSPAFITQHGRPTLSIDFALWSPSNYEIGLIDKIVTHNAALGSDLTINDYVALQRMLDEPSRRGLRARWIANYVQEPINEVMSSVADHYLVAPSAHTVVFFEHLHGAFATPRFPSSFAGRSEKYSMLGVCSWSKELDDAHNIAWTNDLLEVVRTSTSPTAAYSNYTESSLRGLPSATSSTISRVRKRFDADIFKTCLPPAMRF